MANEKEPLLCTDSNGSKVYAHFWFVNGIPQFQFIKRKEIRMEKPGFFMFADISEAQYFRAVKKLQAERALWPHYSDDEILIHLLAKAEPTDGITVPAQYER